MSDLEDFLNLKDVDQTIQEIKVNVGSKELSMKIKALSQDRHAEFQKRCQTNVRGVIGFDVGKYNSLALVECIVEPNFKKEDFLTRAGCSSAVEFLNKKFPAGVLATIAEEIQKLSGFTSIQKDIETAKN